MAAIRTEEFIQILGKNLEDKDDYELINLIKYSPKFNFA